MRLLECRVCHSINELNGHRVTCSCGRSFAQMRNETAEFAGPGRVLLAVDILLPEADGRRTVLPEDPTARRIPLGPII